jgi:lipoprotein-anchoring transpeptidase ErfK/SrfK
MRHLLTTTCCAALLFSMATFAQSYQPQTNTYVKNGMTYIVKDGVTYRTRGERMFVFEPRHNYWAAYEDGHKVASGVANGGTPDGEHETPTGVFHIYDKKGVNYVSSKYPINPDGSRGGAQMPYAMHFTKSGHAIHGSPGVSRTNSSHGCIRVQTAYAKWLNESFMTPSTKVVVYPY